MSQSQTVTAERAGQRSALTEQRGEGTVSDSVKTTAEDQAQITALLDRYETALNASDVGAVLDLYARDGVFMPSSAPTAEGAEQVRGSYEFVFSTIQLAIRFSIDEIEVHGDLAFARTASEGTVTTLADATSPAHRFQYNPCVSHKTI